MSPPPLPVPLRSPLRRAPLAIALAAVAVIAGACGDAAPTGPKGASMQETYPVRQILIRYDRAPERGSPDGASDPKAPSWKGRTRAEAKKRAAEVLLRVRAPGADFAAIATEVSEEEGTKTDGGFVGFVSLFTSNNPVLVNAAASVAPGGVSEPMETDFGFHLIQRLTREDGKALEARLFPVLEGVVLPYHEVSKNLDVSLTKPSAYAAAAHLVSDLRDGRALYEMTGTLNAPIEVHEAYRRPLPASDDRLWKAAVALVPGGDWSDPVDTSIGWAVVKRVPHTRCYVRHIVVSHQMSPREDRPKRAPQEALQRATEALAMVRADRSRWNDVVEEYSDEAASAKQGGFMGDVCNSEPMRRRAPPEFEQAIFALKPGDIGEVVETRFGFHIFWRVD